MGHLVVRQDAEGADDSEPGALRQCGVFKVQPGLAAFGPIPEQIDDSAFQVLSIIHAHRMPGGYDRAGHAFRFSGSQVLGSAARRPFFICPGAAVRATNTQFFTGDPEEHPW